MAKKQFRVGMVGYGFMGRAHTNAYKQVGQFFPSDHQVVLQAVAARDADKVKAFADQWGYASTETDWRKLVERKDIDAIDICTPNNLHAEIALAAAANGKAILCEKPLAMDAAEGLKMVRAVEAAKVPNMVWYNYRRIPAVTLAKRLIDEGRLGKVFHYRAKFLQDWTIKSDLPQGGQGLWRLDLAAAGAGVSGDLLAHCIDTALWFNGRMDTVCAMTETFVKERMHTLTGKVEKVGIDDACSFFGRFENGSLANFESTRYARGHKALYTLEINGEDMSLFWDLHDLHRLQIFDYKDEGKIRGWKSVHVTDNSPDHPYMDKWWVPGLAVGYDTSFTHQVADFIEGLTTGKPASPTFRDALETQFVLDAVLDSAKKQQWVTVGKAWRDVIAASLRASESTLAGSRRGKALKHFTWCAMAPRRSSLLLLALLASPAPAADVSDFFPVVAGDTADPWVVRHDGWYYLTATTGTNVTVWRSKSLSGIGGGETKVIWTPPPRGPASKNLWAPELHRLNGKWYVYYAADDGANENHRMFALENASADPFDGTFEFKGKIADPKADRWAIDGTVLAVKDKNYFVWSGWVADTNVRQELYIAPMKDPWTLAGPRVEISRPTHKWETVGEPTVNEGPQALVRNGTVHLVYSASGSWTDDYCLGLLTLKKDGDPLDPKAWAKHPKPVFEKTKSVFGPGHCSFTTSPDGKEDWLVYHAARHTNAGWARNIRMQPFEWGKDDTPKFGTPADASKLLKLPGGDPKRVRLEAAGDAKAAVSKKGGAIEFTPEAKAKGMHTLTVRYANDAAKKEPVAVGVRVNGKALAPAECEYTAGDWSAAVLRVELKEGANTVVLTVGKPGVTIDCVDSADAR